MEAERSEVIAQGVIHARAGIQGGRRDRHHPAKAEPGEGGLEPHRGLLGLSREDHEEPDQAEPEQARGSREGTEEPERDQRVGEAAADPRRGYRRAFDTPAAPPQQGAKDAAAVEREGGNQVEDENHRVHIGLVGEERRKRIGRRIGQRRSGEAEDEHDHGGHRRSRESEAKLLPGLVCGALHPRHPPEQPELDPLDLDPIAPGDDRVAELVQEDACEEEQRAGEAERVGGSGLDPGHLFGVIGIAQRPGDQRDDREPKGMDADRNPGEASDPDALSEHPLVLLGADDLIALHQPEQ